MAQIFIQLGNQVVLIWLPKLGLWIVYSAEKLNSKYFNESYKKET